MVVGRTQRSVSGRISNPTRSIPAPSAIPSRLASRAAPAPNANTTRPALSRTTSVPATIPTETPLTDEKTDPKPDDKSTNIKVVVRCRGRNDREVKAKSGVVIDTNPAQPTECMVSMDGSTARAAGQETKTYKLDHVFGPEADQSMVYDEVVAPMLSEVITGMNCTIFAYGQTGTGKT